MGSILVWCFHTIDWLLDIVLHLLAKSGIETECSVYGLLIKLNMLIVEAKI